VLSTGRLSRRAALGRAGALAAALGLGGPLARAVAQDATPATPAATPASATPPATPTAEGQTATVNGADLYYEVHGPAAGQPVLLLHGALGNTEEFDNLVPALVAAGYRTVAFDARGRGRSTWGDAPITFEQMAADALGLLDHLGIARADVVGSSQGGTVALELAIRHAARLGRVVVYGAIFAADGEYDAPQPSDELPPFEQFVADYQRLSPQPERFEELLDALGALEAVAPNYSEADLGSIAVPVLVLDGAEEEFVKPEHTKRMAELIPGAQLVIMPGTGHFAPLAQPDEFNRIVLEFLQA
jgi:pimeloyl-ACP methyl ester carboxylesterase